jgi:hypothetical protein
LAGEIRIDSRLANHLTSPWPLAVTVSHVFQLLVIMR